MQEQTLEEGCRGRFYSLIPEIHGACVYVYMCVCVNSRVVAYVYMCIFVRVCVYGRVVAYV